MGTNIPTSDLSPTSVSREGSRRFTLNVTSNLGMVVLNVVVGLWLTRYLVTELGAALYGLIALATSVTLYMSVLSDSINGALGRWLTIAIRRHDVPTANVIFNTALVATVVLSLVLLPGITALAYFIPQIFDVPDGYASASRWLFGTVMLAYLLTMVRGGFDASTFVHSRFDLQNLVRATNLLVRILVMVALFQLASPNLEAVGIATLVAVAVSFGLAWRIWRRLTPELRVNPRLFEHEHLVRMGDTSAWFLVNQVGSLLLLNSELIIVNLTLGSEVAGRYGIVLQWPILLRALASTVSSVLTPTILAQYARNDLNSVVDTTRQAIKLMGLAFALPIGLLVGLAPMILTVWLGSEFADLAPLMVVMVAHLSINIAVHPLFSAQIALNRVRWPGILTLVIALINLPLAIWWASWLPNGMGVALAGALLLTLKNTIFIPVYHARIQQVPWFTFHRAMLPGLLMLLLVAGASSSLLQFIPSWSWFSLIMLGIGLTLGYAVLVYAVGLDQTERQLVQRILKFSRG